MASQPLVITYKTKVRQMEGRAYIDFKRTFSRKDCSLRPHEHDYYNSDLFPGLLRRFAEKMQRGRSWAYLDELPAGITVDQTGFLSTITYRETVAYVSIVDALEESFHKKSRWDRQNGIQSTYFTCTVHKKGTIHLTFRDPDILRRFNVVACKGKNWLPEDYGARKFSQLTPEEREVVTSFEENVKAYDKSVGKALYGAAAMPQMPMLEAA